MAGKPADGPRVDELAAQRAAGRALRRLAALHRDELRALTNEERAREGVPPLHEPRGAETAR